VNRPAFILTALLAAAAAPGADVTVSLGLAAAQDPSHLPCRTAELTIDYSGSIQGRVIRSARLRERQGGPTIVCALSVAPGSRGTVAVALPAWTQQQEYAVDLLSGDDDGSGVLAGASASILWPLETIQPGDFINPRAYEPWSEDLPTWPESLKRNVFLAAALTCIALAAALLLRRGVVRIAAIVAAAAGAVLALSVLLSTQQMVVQKQSRDGSVLALTCRRTATWQSSDSRLFPIYYSQRQMQDDTTVICAGKGIRLELHPNEVRLLRRPGPAAGSR